MTNKRTTQSTRFYTQDEIAQVESVFGKGFLWRNPHFPAPGTYIYEDGSHSSAYALTLKQRQEIAARD